MTVLVTWYRKKFDQVWCMADTRISGRDGIATDGGPKILPIPITTHLNVSGSGWAPHQQFSLGFAYAGSTLSAVSTHALASACTQSLACSKPDIGPPSVKSVAELFRKVGQHYVRDISSHMVGSQVKLTEYFFRAHIFGFCRASNRYRAFSILPELLPEVSMTLEELDLADGMKIYPLGSGAQALIQIIETSMRARTYEGPIPALREMLRQETMPDVGGYFQCGTADRSGFSLRPILNTNAPQDRHVTFLGFSVNDIGELDGHSIGYIAIAPDLD
jgi:hypothetical protein